MQMDCPADCQYPAGSARSPAQNVRNARDILRPQSNCREFTARKEILAAPGDLGYRGGPTEIAGAFLADYAFTTNSASVSLVSMPNNGHRHFNPRRLKNDPTPERLNAVIVALDMGAKD
ncbi:hypothetical protein [Mesorhizobium intechi]|uniref:hypothetical protein n=1 Tax=Mesorhizobium intechi TaxID=537601 RepID=UPI001FEA165F|nr:hypothetical protein [Mesorhizobium intechi]